MLYDLLSKLTGQSGMFLRRYSEKESIKHLNLCFSLPSPQSHAE